MINYAHFTTVDKSWSTEEKIGFLRYCAKRYESDGTSPLSDKEYDILYAEMEQLAPNDPFFEEVGGLDTEHVYGTAVKHDVIMGSLNKSLDIASFSEWLRSTYPDTSDVSFWLEHKIDGLSLGLIYQNGKLVRAVTRGDGVTGVDVTANAVFVKGVREKIDCQDEVEIRGECYKDRHDFYKKWHSQGYKNPRNFTSGSINQKDPAVTKERELSFIAYEVVRKDFSTELEKHVFLEKMGFTTLNASMKRTKANLSHAQIATAVQYYMDNIDRSQLPYDIDGVVVKLNDSVKAKKMGTVAGGRKPKSNRAVKFPPEEKDTILIGVDKKVGRTGALCPVAILKPVELGGAMISKATLHNYGALVGKDAIRIGAVVTIAKKGDIIPQIVKVKKNGDKDIEIPKTCPVCGNDLEWTDTKVDLVCTNIACIAQLNKRIEHWFKTLGVKGIASKTIGRLTDSEELSWEGHAIVESLPEMYYMLDNDRRSEHPFRKYSYLKEYFGEKKYQNILESIHSVTEVPLYIFIEALGIEGIGSISKDIADIAPSIEEIDKLTVEDLIGMSSFGPIKAQNFVNGWKALRKEISLLLKYIKLKQQSVSSNKLAGKKFCFTGSFSSPTRSEMEAIVPANGGKIGSVGKDLTALVWDGETMKGKYDKAKKLGIPIITQDDFMAML